MENNAAWIQGLRAGQGPVGPAPQRPMSESRSALLGMLRGQPEPVTLAALVSATGLHANTVREHLDALVRSGHVRRHRSEPSGRGRPAWRYEATPSGGEAGSEYAGLAAVLAATLARTAEDPTAAATAAGEDWGRELARDRGAVPTTPEGAREQVNRLLDDLGFAPEVDPGAPEHVRLTRCPLLEAAHRHPEVVCGVHLGIVRGALEEYGADPAGTELHPFAEPRACTLLVPPADATVEGRR